MKKTNRFLSAFLALVMAFALAVPAFADSVPMEWAEIEEAGCLNYTVAPTGIARVYNDAGYEWIWPVFDQAVTFTVKDGGSFYDVGAPKEGYRVNEDGSATLSADAKGLYGLLFEWYAWPGERVLSDNYCQVCTKSYVDEMIANGERVEYIPNDNPTTPTEPNVPVQPDTPAQPSTPANPTTPNTPSTTTVAKPAPGVSVPLNNGANAYLGEYLYTVKSGDTLSKIADYYYGVPGVYELIYSYNKDILKSADKIYAGQTITLPSYAAVDLYLASAYPRESSNGGTAYVVKSGDSLSKIAKAAYGDATKWTVIYEANRDLLKSPSRIYPGQVLIIPAL